MAPWRPPELPPHRSIGGGRLDYSHPGIYFVTLCAHQREEVFGAVVDGEMKASPLGWAVRKGWFHSIETCREIECFKSEFVLMPNHLHSLVWIVAPDETPTRGIPRRAPRSLIYFLARFKASVTGLPEQATHPGRVWQPGEHIHLVRSEDELQKLRVYIHTNPESWLEDQLNTAVATPFNQDH